MSPSELETRREIGQTAFVSRWQFLLFPRAPATMVPCAEPVGHLVCPPCAAFQESLAAAGTLNVPRARMRLLVVHAWLRGNLGDVLQASVLLRALRDLRPAVLDVAGYPARPACGTEELVALADRYVSEPFPWYWRYAPQVARGRALEPHWRRRRSALFSSYDAIISAPGPFLAEYDLRSPSALLDVEVAADLGIPFLLASHSIGPLPARALTTLRRATLCVARESATHQYLAERGIQSTPSADYAFLYPYQERPASGVPTLSIRQPYRLLFVRSNNFSSRSIRVGGNRLWCGALEVPLQANESVVLATSDAQRDGRFIRKLAKRLGVPSVRCTSVAELVALIAGSSGVVSDRYHPAICSATLGKPTDVMINHEPHKMHGLKDLLHGHDLRSLQDLARAGLAGLRTALADGASGQPPSKHD